MGSRAFPFLLMLSLVAIFAHSNAQAQKTSKGKKEASKIQVRQLDPDFDVEKFKSPNVEVHKAADEKLPPAYLKNTDDTLAAHSLEPETKSWDAVDKDILLVRAKTLDSGELTKAYPKLSRAKLRRLREHLRKK